VTPIEEMASLEISSVTSSASFFISGQYVTRRARIKGGKAGLNRPHLTYYTIVFGQSGPPASPAYETASVATSTPSIP